MHGRLLVKVFERLMFEELLYSIMILFSIEEWILIKGRNSASIEDCHEIHNPNFRPWRAQVLEEWSYYLVESRVYVRQVMEAIAPRSRDSVALIIVVTSHTTVLENPPKEP